jgi:ribosomal protein S18 acetylase RimI-like enzyme
MLDSNQGNVRFFVGNKLFSGGMTKMMNKSKTRERIPMEHLYFENRHIDYVGKGEHKFTLFVAYKDDPKLRVIGYVDYATVDDELYVEMIEVAEEERGKGIGKALYQKLYELNPNMKFVDAGYYTEAGRRLRDWFNQEVLQNVVSGA